MSTDGPQEAWFTENAEISRQTHAYYANGVTPPLIEDSTVKTILEIVEFDDGQVTDDSSAIVSEATGFTESAQESDTNFVSVAATVEVVAEGYIREFHAEIDIDQDDTDDQTSRVIYRNQVTSVGDVSVSPPDFADSAMHITGELADDDSALILEHAGGPPIGTEAELTFQDNEYILARSGERPSFPEEFTEGDTAYLYWSGAEEASISMGEAPSDVARDIAQPTDDGRGVYLEGNPPSQSGTFEIRL